MHQVRQPGTQDRSRAGKVGVELVASGFFLLPLVVTGGRFVGAGVGGVEDGGQQDDQFAGPVAVPVGQVVLDHPGQVDDRQATLVERVRDRVDVGQVGPVAGGGR